MPDGAHLPIGSRSGRSGWHRLGSYWEFVLDVLAVLAPTRFPIIVLLLGTILLLFVQQAQDALYVLVAGVSGCGGAASGRCDATSFGKLALFLGCWFLWAFNTFYAARFMSRLPPRGRIAFLAALGADGRNPFHIYPPPLLQHHWINCLDLYLPRTLGGLVIFSVWLSLQWASWSLGSWAAVQVAIVSLAMLAAYALVVSKRRELVRRLGRRVNQPRMFHVSDTLQDERLERILVLPRSRKILVGVTCAIIFLLFLASAKFDLREWSWLVSGPGLVAGALICWLVALITLRSWTSIPGSTRWFIAVQITVMMGLFTLSLKPGLPVVGFVGSPAIVVLAAAGWAFGGTILLAFPAEITGLPIFTALIVSAVAFSASGRLDNHVIRTSPALAEGARVEAGSIGRDFPPTDASPCRPLATPDDPASPGSDGARADSLARAYQRWCLAAAKQWDRPGPVPLIIVATAGGASRAAYWTEKVLGEFESHVPGFHNYVFAISSVSGGTLGAAAYRLSLDLPPVAPSASVVRGGAVPGRPPMQRLLDLLQRDFLAALLLGGSYSDLVQRALPGSLLPDRAAALEQSWESAWTAAFPGVDERGWLGQPFLRRMNGFWATPGEWRPLMLFNGTSVMTGRRIITSNMKIGGQFPGAFDFHDWTGRDVPLSTAIHNSARFPYLDAAGNIERGRDGVILDRIVDGGYFENFGAATAADVLEQLIQRGAVADRPEQGAGGRTIAPIVIQISNDASVPSKTPLGADATKRVKPISTAFRVLSDVSTPLVAFYDTRAGLGERASEVLRRRLAHLHTGKNDDSRYFHFRIADKRVPMSWLLSDYASRLIDAQLPLEAASAASVVGSPSALNSARCNVAQFLALAKLLAKPAADPGGGSSRGTTGGCAS